MIDDQELFIRFANVKSEKVWKSKLTGVYYLETSSRELYEMYLNGHRRVRLKKYNDTLQRRFQKYLNDR